MQKERGDIFSKNTKGQEMSVTTIILIVLGLAVLIILIIGFRIGWNKILPFLPTNNVKTVDNFIFSGLFKRFIKCERPRSPLGKRSLDVLFLCLLSMFGDFLFEFSDREEN